MTERRDTTATAATDVAFPQNQIIVVGVVAPTRQGRMCRWATAAPPPGGLLERVTLQLESPYGEPFGMQIDISPQASGLELLDAAVIGTPISLEGSLRMVSDLDTRYTSAGNSEGRRYREVRLRVSDVRSPRSYEMLGSSLVRLSGRVVEPPRADRHPSVPDLQLASTLIAVQMVARASYPGSQMTTPVTYQIPVTIPIDHPHAGRLFKAGNDVQIEGVLDRRMVPLRGAAVDAHIAELRAAFAEESTALKGQARRDAERRHLSECQRLLRSAIPIVQAGYVALLHGEEQEYAAARKARAVYTDQIKASRAIRRRVVVPQIARAVPEDAPATDADASEEAVSIEIPRSRRRREEVAVVEATPLE